MRDITHISVGPGAAADPGARTRIVYVKAPAPDVLDAEPFVSGRHRIERTPGTERAPSATTLWSWSACGG